MSDVRRSPAAATLGGATNVAVVLALYDRGEYPALEVPAELAVLVLTSALVGAVVVGASAHTRLLTPAVGLAALLVGVIALETTTPTPTWERLGDAIVVDGPTHASSYATAWPLWLALGCYLGTLEYALRDRYALAADRLANLPTLATDRRRLVGQLGTVAGFLGLATGLLVVDSGGGLVVAVVVAILTAATGLVALVALVRWRLVGPAVCVVGVLPSILLVEVFRTTESPVHFLLLGPFVLVLVLVAGLERAVRLRAG